MSARKAAIIGGGVIGGGWAARFLLNGWDVALADPAPNALAAVKATIARAATAYVALYDAPLPERGTLTHTSLAEAVTDAAWIQESLPERLSLKHGIYAEIAEHTDLPVASSTSGFMPSELGAGAFVAHPYNPVYLLPVVELVFPETIPQPARDRMAEVLTGIGMSPLTLRREIPAHIGDRLLEALWREALWLVRDGIATTEEIDRVITHGFGLRWAQMGLFETYRIAGGEAGMAHFLAQFGPCLQEPWTKLTEVPELNDDLIATIATQSDAQSGHFSIAELEAQRDRNLVAILRHLRSENWAAGTTIR
ncbi:hypothetical protein GO499_07665 [Algicella marina]|uniref:CDH n=1 Tax=Algicella marina TaxID=2683284 RepID=A0A6P1T039_9RHOB|nr:hypothetical protein GO499_07665 [Algicella marina]